MFDADDVVLGAKTVIDTDAPLYSTATRWRTYLCNHSDAFRNLQEERERGWQSSALDAWYTRRQAPSDKSDLVLTNNTDEPAVSATRTTVPDPKNARPNLDTSSTITTAKKTAVGTTSFVEADIPALAERYRQHARRITQHAASAFFTAAATAAPSRLLFLDLGCAPGGVSKYLLDDLQWRGVGVTLPSESGGIDVDPALVTSHTRAHAEADYLLLDGDITAPPSTWRRSAAYALVSCNDASSQELVSAVIGAEELKLTEELFQEKSGTTPTFHFVNGGAVLDHGQRQRWERAIEENASSSTVACAHENTPNVPPSSSAGRPASALTSSSSVVLEPVLPWFSLLVPQLRVALTYAAEGGAIMLVHGAPHCASLFILLRCMEAVVGTAPRVSAPAATAVHHTLSPALQSSCRVHLLETMHLAKPPLYVLWTNIWSHTAGSEGASVAGAVKAAAQDAQRRLLDALDPASPRVSPFDAEATHDVATTAKQPPRSVLVEKQRFWLGESEEGFRLAVEGFERYGAQAEAHWTRVAEFLRRRRERAEREMRTGGSTSYTPRTKAPGGQNGRTHAAHKRQRNIA